MVSVPRVDASRIGVLVIDVQPFFLDEAFGADTERRESLLVRLEHLLMLAGWMDLPTVATFEIPTETNGELPERLETVFPAGGVGLTKRHFGCMSEPSIAAAIEQLGVAQLAVAGAETDVCVLQSTLGLLDAGYEVLLLEDCLFTTEPHPGPALRRMYAAGAVPTTMKTLAYELVQCADRIPWYPEQWAADDRPATPFPAGFIPPEEWPDWTPAF